ncbi:MULTISPECIES: MarC family NAAT transporter [Lysobacter]|uniref:MarC family NAAT transporter n=1 Tax=Lysobacter TaxID=68 RepID=UPI001F378EB1|nr:MULTISPECIES: MarC family NAAT transporter [Lysobacter]UJB18750.1 MarC family NAAT transporter [Lysobacter capsici]UJQ27525.1 MarC family NAAT transporter [Lysobacter gummosus]
MSDYLQKVVFGFATLLPLANPLATMALLPTISRHYSAREIDRQIIKTSINVVVIMVATYYLGTMLMHGLGISIPGLRIAGGLTVSYIGFSMLFPSAKDDQETLSEDVARQPKKMRDFSFFPLAMPSTIGPGSMALIVSIASTAQSEKSIAWTSHLAVLTVAALFGALTWVGLKGAGSMMRVLGASGLDAISRLMGFLLISMGVQFVINGGLEIYRQELRPQVRAEADVRVARVDSRWNADIAGESEFSSGREWTTSAAAPALSVAWPFSVVGGRAIARSCDEAGSMSQAKSIV